MFLFIHLILIILPLVARLLNTGQAGVGCEGTVAIPWSLMLKEIQSPLQADLPDWEVENWVYWERESLLYAAGIPQTLTGDLRAPRCYGVTQPEPGLRWIWLEAIQDRYQRLWPLEQYRLAACQLGAFNGSYLVDKAQPKLPCLAGNRLRSRSATMIENFDRLRQPALWQHPRLRQVVAASVPGDLERLFNEREHLLAVAARLPQTFCHLDVHVGNMAALPAADEAARTVLFDWAIAGYAAVGGEIANLIWSSFLEFKWDVAEATMFDGYCQGLAEAGCQINPDWVRCGYLIHALLIFGLLPEAVDHALNEAEHAALEQYYGWSIERIIAQAAAVTDLLLMRAEELGPLIRRLSM